MRSGSSADEVGSLVASTFPLHLQTFEWKIHDTSWPPPSLLTLREDDGGKGRSGQFPSEMAGEGRRHLVVTRL